jgi:hypothetical protein
MNKARGRPFSPGNTVGRGRPKGSRNKSKSPTQDLFDEYSLHVARKCIFQAIQGDKSAMRICMERIIPARQDTFIPMNLPVIRKAQDLDKAAEKVMQGVRRGRITPVEGGRVMNILESRVRIIERVQWEDRITRLEGTVTPADLPLAA